MKSQSVTCHLAVVRILPLPPAEAGTRFSDPGGMQSWDDLCYVKADRLGIEPATCKSNALPQHHHATWYGITIEESYYMLGGSLDLFTERELPLKLGWWILKITLVLLLIYNFKFRSAFPYYLFSTAAVLCSVVAAVAECLLTLLTH